MCHLDLKADFLHVPIDKKSRKLLRFSIEGTLYDQNLKTTIDLLKSLGFLINYEKTDLHH